MIIEKNGIFTQLSDSFVELSARKLELDQLREGDPELIAAMYEALATDFEHDSHYFLAEKCRKSAASWRKA